MAKCYSAAMPVLDQEFDDVDPKKTGMTARDFLLFCYYGGMIYTGGAAILTVPGLQIHVSNLCQKFMKEMSVPGIHGEPATCEVAPGTRLYAFAFRRCMQSGPNEAGTEVSMMHVQASKSMPRLWRCSCLL